MLDADPVVGSKGARSDCRDGGVVTATVRDVEGAELGLRGGVEVGV